MRNRESAYMHWAKVHSRAKFNLATSGVGLFPLSELPFDFQSLEINGPTTYGYEPLQRAIAEKNGVDPDCVVTAAGTSMANHLAMATLLENGDEVLIEKPAYELLVSTARYFTDNVKRFERREENGYALDSSEVARLISPKTRLIVVSNLHNPSSVLASEVQLRAVGDLARQVGARVLVDEVYLDAVYDNTPKSSIHYGPEFVVTSSLTKVYGLSGLRCGWILADPDLARRMWRLNDLFGSIPAFPAEQLSVAAFTHLQSIRARAQRVLECDQVLLTKFLCEQTRIGGLQAQWGTTCFAKLLDVDIDKFLTRLREDYETTVVPGRFFDQPDHFRIGMGVNNEMFAQGLDRVARALSDLPARSE